MSDLEARKQERRVWLRRAFARTFHWRAWYCVAAGTVFAGLWVAVRHPAYLAGAIVLAVLAALTEYVARRFTNLNDYWFDIVAKRMERMGWLPKIRERDMKPPTRGEELR